MISFMDSTNFMDMTVFMEMTKQKKLSLDKANQITNKECFMIV